LTQGVDSRADRASDCVLLDYRSSLSIALPTNNCYYCAGRARPQPLDRSSVRLITSSAALNDGAVQFRAGRRRRKWTFWRLLSDGGGAGSPIGHVHAIVSLDGGEFGHVKYEPTSGRMSPRGPPPCNDDRGTICAPSLMAVVGQYAQWARKAGRRMPRLLCYWLVGLVNSLKCNSWTIKFNLANLGRHAQLTRCFSAVAELLARSSTTAEKQRISCACLPRLAN